MILHQSRQECTYISDFFSNLLGEEIKIWIQKHRKENKEWFDLAEEINHFAHKNLYNLDIKTDAARHLVVSSAYLRSLSLFQGTMIMAERGMIYEACTLTRGLLETLFVLCASADTPDFAEQYLESSELTKLDNLSRLLKAGPEIRKIVEETITKDEIDAKRMELRDKGIRDYKIAEIAEKANLVDFYRVNYSYFSLMAAHPTPDSLAKYMESGASGNIEGLLWGPDVEGIDRILSVVIESLIIAIGRTAEVFSQSWTEQAETFEYRFRSLGERLADFSIGHIRT